MQRLSRAEEIRLCTMLSENWIFPGAHESILMNNLAALRLVSWRESERDWCLTEDGLAVARALTRK